MIGVSIFKSTKEQNVRNTISEKEIYKDDVKNMTQKIRKELL